MQSYLPSGSTFLEQPLLEGDDTPEPVRINVIPDSQIQRLSSVQSNFDELMVPATKRGRRYIAATFFLLACTIVSSYFSSAERERTSYGFVLLALLAVISGLSAYVTGCMSIGYCCGNCRGASCFGIAGNEFSGLISSHSSYKETKSAALNVTRSLGIEIKDGEDPYQIQAALKQADKKVKENAAKRLAFVSASHLRLGESSALQNTLFSLGGAGRGKTRHAICEEIFEYAGMKL